MLSKNLKKILIFVLILSTQHTPDYSVAIAIAIPEILREATCAAVIIVTALLSQKSEQKNSLVMHDMVEQIQQAEQATLCSSNPSIDVHQDPQTLPTIATHLANLQIAKLRSQLGKQQPATVYQAVEWEQHTPQATYQWRPIPYGIRIETNTGFYAQAQFREKSASEILDEQRRERWLQETFETLVRMQLDPEYLEKTLEKLNYTLEIMLKTNSESLIDRIESRLLLYKLKEDIKFDTLYDSHVQQCIKDLIRLYFHKKGNLRFTERSGETKSIVQTFFNNSCIEKSAEEFTELNKEANYHRHPVSVFIGQKMGIRTSTTKVCERIAEYKSNKSLYKLINCCRQFDFEAAKKILSAEKEAEYQKVMREILRDSETTYKSQLLDERGIYRKCLSDPLLKTFSSNDLLSISKNAPLLAKLNQRLLIRDMFKESMMKNWQISHDASPIIHDALYHLMGVNDEGITDIKALASRALEITSHYTDPENQQIISALFLPNGVFKDFAHYPRVKRLNIPSAILLPHNHEIRLALNHLLNIEHAQAGNEKARKASQALEYIEAFFVTQDTQTQKEHICAYEKIFYHLCFDPLEKNNKEGSLEYPELSPGPSTEDPEKEPKDKKKATKKKDAKPNYTQQTKEQLQRSKTSFEKQIRKHELKLEEYIKNPEKYDHREILTNVSAEIRKKIINTRIKHLEQEIKGFKQRLDEINNILKSL